MIYQSIDFNSFQRAFINAGRDAQFSAKGLHMLYDWLVDLSNDTEQDIELDVIALCCQYSELDKESYLMEYSDVDGAETIEELEQALINGGQERVIAHDLYNNIILVDVDY